MSKILTPEEKKSLLAKLKKEGAPSLTKKLGQKIDRIIYDDSDLEYKAEYETADGTSVVETKKKPKPEKPAKKGK